MLVTEEEWYGDDQVKEYILPRFLRWMDPKIDRYDDATIVWNTSYPFDGLNVAISTSDDDHGYHYVNYMLLITNFLTHLGERGVNS